MPCQISLQISSKFLSPNAHSDHTDSFLLAAGSLNTTYTVEFRTNLYRTHRIQFYKEIKGIAKEKDVP